MMKRETAKRHIDKKLRFRLRIYIAISGILLAIVIYEILTGIVSFPLASLGILLGVGLGILTARMFHLTWNHDAKQIVSRLDMFGGVILVLYILFALFRGQIVSQFVHGPAVGGVSLSLATGIMAGRVLGTRGKIIKILKEQEIL